jgi:hypothetical protein
MSAQKDAAATRTRIRTRIRARVLAAGAAGAAMAAIVTLALALTGPAASASARPHPKKAHTQVNYMASPSTYGYPDATNSGVPAGTRLLSVPGQVSSGPGWRYLSSGYVSVSGNGAVLSGLYIPYNLDITASNVTIRNSKVVTGGSFAVSLRHTSGVTIANSTISGSNATTGRAGVTITDVYGDSTGMNITGNNISNFKTAIQVSTGTITGNYIHDPGFVSGDHTNGIFDTGSTQPLVITGNTIFNSFGQTDAISLDASQAGQVVANKTIENNLLAGGGYTIYGGTSLGNSVNHILIKNNRFGQGYFPRSGQWGPIAYASSAGTNVWSGNVWDSTAAAIPAP